MTLDQYVGFTVRAGIGQAEVSLIWGSGTIGTRPTVVYYAFDVATSMQILERLGDMYQATGWTMRR